jgi:hypothetical protein
LTSSGDTVTQTNNQTKQTSVTTRPVLLWTKTLEFPIISKKQRNHLADMQLAEEKGFM